MEAQEQGIIAKPLSIFAKSLEQLRNNQIY